MSDFIIEGGQRLAGELPVAGAKNLALKAIAAALLSPETMRLSNVPEIEDVKRQLEILTRLGAEVSHPEHGVYTISTAPVRSGAMPRELVNKLRASTVLTGPLLARFGKVELSHPGGCKIGRRPIDLFLRGFQALGAEVKEVPGKAYQLRAKRLRGGRIVFPKVSVTGTETMMLAAVLAEGKTELVNAALEPEIGELAVYLNAHGARISGAGTPLITIEGVAEIGAGSFVMMPDRIEAGTFIMLALATASSVTITRCEPKHLEVPLALWRDMGAEFELGPASVTVGKARALQAVDVKTHEYPGFVTDLQSSMTVLLTQAQGHSLVHETIFEGRLFFADILNQMGADITLCDPHRVIIQGPTPLEGRTIEAPDARAGLALLTAALAAKGTSTIKNIYPIDRGYERLEERLLALGAHIQRA
ncbi:MAG: UDP-N-acetylglucosamine 1-carboxyvinyltransferase [Candidatus Veblenbacteria bacterium]|nr:UDP-N-acetylglucosamine 1-carboxyvinyltransferase [Candidatus Veblenbacteria bacterium]